MINYNINLFIYFKKIYYIIILDLLLHSNNQLFSGLFLSDLVNKNFLTLITFNKMSNL